MGQSLSHSVTTVSDTPSATVLRLVVTYSSSVGVSDSRNAFTVTGNWPNVSTSVAISLGWGGGSQTLYDQTITVTKTGRAQSVSVSAALTGINYWGATAVVTTGGDYPVAAAVTPGTTTTTTTVGTTTTTTTAAPTTFEHQPFTSLGETRPVYRADAERFLTQSWSPIVQVHLWKAGEAYYETEPLDLISGTLTLDESWSPHAQGDLTFAIPDEDTMDALDPRSGARVVIFAGYKWSDGLVDVQRFANLWVWDRVIARPRDTMTLRVLSSEVWPGDFYAPTATGWVYPAGVSSRDVITDMLVLAGWDEIKVDLPVGVLNPSDVTVEDGGVWDTLRTVEDASEAWVYCDAKGVWHVDSIPALSSEPVHYLKVGVSGTIEESQASLTSSNGWASALLVTHQWTDDAGAHKVTGWASTPTDGPAFWRRISKDTPISSRKAANREAKSILARMVSRGRSVPVKALSALWLRPGDTVALSLVTGPSEKHLVERVTFDLVEGSMSLTTRLPLDVTITTGE